MSDLATLARESYADDVRAVAGELAQAADVRAFAESLQEFVELASADYVFVAVDGDALVVRTEAGTFRLTVTQERDAYARSRESRCAEGAPEGAPLVS